MYRKFVANLRKKYMSFLNFIDLILKKSLPSLIVWMNLSLKCLVAEIYKINHDPLRVSVEHTNLVSYKRCSNKLASFYSFHSYIRF